MKNIIIIAILFIFATALHAQFDNLNQSIPSNNVNVRTVKDIIKDINTQQSCKAMDINFTEVKGSKYTAFALGSLYTKSNQSGLTSVNKSSNQSTLEAAYSDRRLFKGQKNVQSVDIQIKIKQVVLTTYYHYTGGKAKTVWQNIQIRKEKHGYFVTAQSGTGKNTKFLTLAITDGICLL